VELIVKSGQELTVELIKEIKMSKIIDVKIQKKMILLLSLLLLMGTLLLSGCGVIVVENIG
jgi:hypothetical protein